MSSLNEIVNSRRLIGGEPDKLMCVSPLKHKWAFDIIDVMEANTWFPQKIDLSGDVLCYRFQLTDAERRMYDKALAFLSNLDGMQFQNLTVNLGKYITSPEVQGAVQRQAWEEFVHVRSYAKLIEAVSLDPMKVYMTFQEDPILAEKNDLILRQAELIGHDYSPRNFAMAVINNICLEGIYFFSGFLSFYVLGKNGKMTGSADMIRYIQRDEQGTHLVLFLHMLRTLQEENPEIFDAQFWLDARELMKSAVELEAAWGKHIISGGVLGMSDRIVDDYMKHLGNKRAIEMGMEELYPGVKNPVPWVESFAGIGKKKVEKNFFEGKVTDYSKGQVEW